MKKKRKIGEICKKCGGTIEVIDDSGKCWARHNPFNLKFKKKIK